MVLVTNYGLYYHETKSKPKKFVIAFTSHVLVRNLFLQLMNSDMPKEDFLAEKVQGERLKAHRNHRFRREAVWYAL